MKDFYVILPEDQELISLLENRASKNGWAGVCGVRDKPGCQYLVFYAPIKEFVLRKSYFSQYKPLTIDEALTRLSETVYAVGDSVITEGYSENYDGEVLKITRIKNECCYFEPSVDDHNFGISHIKRHATAEEIQKATSKITPEIISEFQRAVDSFDSILRKYVKVLK